MRTLYDNQTNAPFSIMNQIHGAEVKDLVTKFFYKGNQLCFQIFLQIEGGERILYKEFTDYAEYKEVFAKLQQQKGSRSIIKFPEKSVDSTKSNSNVA